MGLCLCTNLFAGTMGDVKNKWDVYVPNLAQSNEFTAGALFLRPNGSNDYAVLVYPFNPNVTAPILSPSWESKGINPDFSAGFTLNFRHVFPNSGNDVNLHWDRVHTTDRGTFPVIVGAPPADEFTGPNWEIGPNEGVVSGTNGKVTYNYDSFNAEIGKYVDFDPNLKSHIFMGISTVWLKQQMETNFYGVDPILGPFLFNITTASKFTGTGLRVGLDGEYNGFYGINPVGLLAVNILVGSQQPSTFTEATGGVSRKAGIPINSQFVSHKSYIQMVPGFDAKLGLKYAHQFVNESSMSIEAGYRASLYLDAIQNYVPSTTVPGSLGIVSGGMFLQSLIKTSETFSMDGPYAQLSVKM